MATDRTVPLDAGIPESLKEEMERVAGLQNQTPDAFVEEAIRRQILLARHRALQDFGNDLARRKGFVEGDVTPLVRESRAETNNRRR
jgi:hypothetical protein